jgi:hypothetical protein
MKNAARYEVIRGYYLPAIDADRSWLPDRFDASMPRAVRRASAALLVAGDKAGGAHPPKPVAMPWRDRSGDEWRLLFAMAGACHYGATLRRLTGGALLRQLTATIGVDALKSCLRWTDEGAAGASARLASDADVAQVIDVGAAIVCAHLQSVSPPWLRRVLHRFERGQAQGWLDRAAHLEAGICGPIACHVLGWTDGGAE